MLQRDGATKPWCSCSDDALLVMFYATLVPSRVLIIY